MSEKLDIDVKLDLLEEKKALEDMEASASPEDEATLGELRGELDEKRRAAGLIGGTAIKTYEVGPDGVVNFNRQPGEAPDEGPYKGGRRA